ncbi:MAG: trigger factor [Planctomycetia bacterium]|jgi:trigger factor
MADRKHPKSDKAQAQDASVDTEAAESEEKQKLTLDITVDQRSACERHVKVSVSHEDIDNYFDAEFDELADSAEVPGFRLGHAPRKLIEARFRKDIGDRVKGTLLMDAIAQVNEDEGLAAISEPDFDMDAVTLPEEGPMVFEFDLEVRPEFDVPQWKGLKIEKPIREFDDKDIDRRLEQALANFGRLTPGEEGDKAKMGDYLTLNLTFKDGDNELSAAKEEVIRLRPVLSFRDGKVTNFGKLMTGVKVGDVVEGKATLSNDAPNVLMRGKKVTAVFEVIEIKKLELPEMTPEFLEQIGFETEADLRDAIKDNLEKQLEYEQHQRAREQVTAALTVAADWDLPPDLLKRQSRRELQRAALELQRSGFSVDEIRTHENELRQNSLENTARALKEHFILEKIADQEGIEATEEDIEQEMAAIAGQTGESMRRVRSRIEREGVADALANQVVERKVIDMILADAKFKEVPYKTEDSDTVAIDQTAGGEEEPDIPEATPEKAEEKEEE